MTTRFDQDWLTDTGTYLDDILWPAVVRSSIADSDCTQAQRDAALAAYCKAERTSDAALLIAFIEAADRASIAAEDLYDLVEGHNGIQDIVERVDDAIRATA